MPEPKSILKKSGSKKPPKEVQFENDDNLEKELELEKDDTRGGVAKGTYPVEEEEKEEFKRYKLNETGKSRIKKSGVDPAAKTLLSQELASLNAAVEHAAENAEYAENVYESKEFDNQLDAQLDALDRYVNQTLLLKLDLIKRASKEIAEKRKIITDAEKMFHVPEAEEEKSDPEAEVEKNADLDLPLAREKLIRAQTELESYLSEITTQDKINQSIDLNRILNPLVDRAKDKMTKLQGLIDGKSWDVHQTTLRTLLENAINTRDHEPFEKYLLVLDSVIDFANNRKIAEQYITQLVDLELPKDKQNVREVYQKTLESLDRSEILEFTATLKLLLADQSKAIEAKATEPKKKTGWIGSLFRSKPPGPSPNETRPKPKEVPRPPKGPSQSGSSSD